MSNHILYPPIIWYITGKKLDGSYYILLWHCSLHWEGCLELNIVVNMLYVGLLFIWFSFTMKKSESDKKNQYEKSSWNSILTLYCLCLLWCVICCSFCHFPPFFSFFVYFPESFSEVSTLHEEHFLRSVREHSDRKPPCHNDHARGCFGGGHFPISEMIKIWSQEGRF